MKLLKLTTISLLAASLTFSSCGEDFITVEPTVVATGDQIDDLAQKNPRQADDYSKPFACRCV